MNSHAQTAACHRSPSYRRSTAERSTPLVQAAVALLIALNANGPVTTTLAAPPELAKPTNLTALGSEGQIEISWDESTRGESGFEVHRSSTGAPNSFALHATVDSNGEAFSDQELTPGAHFCYQVRAVRAGSSSTTFSDPSNVACATASPAPIVSYAAVFAGGAHTCALTSVPGAAYCWGRGESGQLGVPAPPSTCLTDGGGLFSCSMVPVAVGGGLMFQTLAGGGSHTCALTGDGTAYCWGRNTRGQLGNGITNHSAVPVAVSGNHTFQLIAAGGFSNGHTCGLTDVGIAYCWGDNERGQLGMGTSDIVPHSFPSAVSGGLVFKGLTAGLGRHSCGLTEVGAAYCWGENTFGALGNRSRRDSFVPVAVTANLSFDQLIAGGFIGHTCALNSGAAYCWGENEKGQVGDGTTRDRFTPQAVVGGLAFLSLDAGFRHTCGVASTGIVYCWGSSGTGQLGNNSNSMSTVPAKVFGQP